MRAILAALARKPHDARKSLRPRLATLSRIAIQRKPAHRLGHVFREIV
jgi:hypothetical protein